MQRPAGAGASQAQIVCNGCRTVLLYPAGAQNVRCARCQTVTSVAPPPQQPDMAQLCCSNAQCRVVLMYPRGAGQVQCSVCGNLNDATQANQLGHIVCGGCNVTLAYAYGAKSVKCAVCSTVTPATPGASTAPAPAAAAQQHQSQYPSGPAQSVMASSKANTATVIVENPTGVDDAGNEVANIAVGVTSKDKPQ